MSFTDPTETDIRDWLFKGIDMPAAPAALDVSLHTSDPGENPDGSTEVSASDYGRVSTAPADWATVGHNGVENANEVDFGTTSNDWGTLSHAVLWDDSGVARAVTELTNPGDTPSGIDVSFPAGTLDFSAD